MKMPLVIICAVLCAFCACVNSPPEATPAGGKNFVDLLAAQLEAINYPSVVTRDGAMVTVRIGAAEIGSKRSWRI